TRNRPAPSANRPIRRGGGGGPSPPPPTARGGGDHPPPPRGAAPPRGARRRARTRPPRGVRIPRPGIDPISPLGRNSRPSPAIRLASNPPTTEPRKPATNASVQAVRPWLRPTITCAIQPAASAIVSSARIRYIGYLPSEGRCSVRESVGGAPCGSSA